VQIPIAAGSIAVEIGREYRCVPGGAKDGSSDRTGATGMPPKLTVVTVRDRLVSELKTIDFTPVKARKLIHKINDETEVFLYPGVHRDGPYVRVDPVIGVDNVRLRERLLALDAKRWGDGKTRVCHVYLGLLDWWGTIYLKTEDELDKAVGAIIRTTVDIGLPRMRDFDSLDKVKALLRDPWSPALKRPKVAVLFEKEKLAVLQEH
jgi:hypothetical protein